MTLRFRAETAHAQVHEYFLQADYTADVAMAFLGNKLIDDDFWHGQPWTIALNRFRSELDKGDMTIRLRPLKKGHPALQSLPAAWLPDFPKGDVCKVRDIRIIPEYQLRIR